MKRVLVVDDKEENIYFLEALLGRGDCRVESARHGAEALARARREPPDLVISDLLMPVMDGYTLLRHWKADPRLRHIPFVVYTATYTEPQDEQLALDLGADAFILKPAEPEAFVERIREVMAGAGATGAVRAAPQPAAELQQVYSSSLIRKLEEKSLLLEETNRALERDIAERRKAEQRLSASESARQATWQSSLDAIITMDHQGQILDLNPAAESMFGYRRDKVVGRPLDRVIIPPELREAHRRGLKQFRETGAGPVLGQRIEMEALRADGSRFPVELAIVALAGGPQPAFLGTIRDITARKAADESLRASEERFRQLAENIEEVFWLTDPDKNRMIYLSPGYEEIWGRPVDEVYRQPLSWLEAIHPEDRARIRELLPHQAEGTFNVEYRIVRPDGSIRWIADRAFPIHDPQGRVYRVAGIARDISRRHVVEAKQRESEERFRLLSRATNDAIWDWNVATDAVWWSDGFTAAFGHRGEDVPTLGDWIGLVHEEDRGTTRTSVEHAMQSGQTSWKCEYRLRRHDGTFAHVQDRGHIIRDAAGRPLRMIGGISDVSERRAYETRLAEQAEVLDKARDAILVADIDTRMKYWNPSAERLYGWTAAEAMGHRATELFFPDPRLCQAVIAEVMARGEWFGEVDQITKDGRKLVVESRINLVRDDAGHPRAVLAINTDITERKKLETQFLRAQRMESVGTLAGGIAHDLNNVLTPIMVSLELLRAGEHDPERLRILSNVQSSANRGADMIRQLLSFTRGVEGVHVAVNVGRIGREIGKIVRDTFPKNVEFRLEAEPGLWSVSADATQMHQVLMNLCVNARDAMAEGGLLEVRMRNRALDAVQAGMSAVGRPGNYVEISVRDGGAGIPAHVQERMFEPFFTTKELGKGTGLGLATVLSIVRSHGGYINAQSEEGRGSTFRVYLPAGAHPEASEHVETRPLVLPRGRGETLLLVDDDESIRAIAATILERHDYAVLTASNGAEAVAMYRQRPAEIALVLTDMAMPVLDGAAAVAALKAINPGLRIVCSSGLASGTDLAAVAAAGVRHFVPKPYTAETILGTIRRALDEPV